MRMKREEEKEDDFLAISRQGKKNHKMEHLRPLFRTVGEKEKKCIKKGSMIFVPMSFAPMRRQDVSEDTLVYCV